MLNDSSTASGPAVELSYRSSTPPSTGRPNPSPFHDPLTEELHLREDDALRVVPLLLGIGVGGGQPAGEPAGQHDGRRRRRVIESSMTASPVEKM